MKQFALIGAGFPGKGECVRRILFVGDVVGRPGRTFLMEKAAGLREEMKLDFLLVNAENAAGGSGLNSKIAKQMRESGVDAITLGDHVWDQKAFADEIGALDWVCRPANLPAICPGRRYLILERDGFRLAVFTVLGRTFMAARECPFTECERVLGEVEGQVDAVVAEVHAEATSEKQALGRFLDGRVAAVIGTHTHVPTADAEVFPNGTAYITDTGMTGPYHSILGREIEPVVARYLDGMPRRFEVASEDVRLSAAMIGIDESSGRAEEISLVVIRREVGTG